MLTISGLPEWYITVSCWRQGCICAIMLAWVEEMGHSKKVAGDDTKRAHDLESSPGLMVLNKSDFVLTKRKERHHYVG